MKENASGGTVWRSAPSAPRRRSQIDMQRRKKQRRRRIVCLLLALLIIASVFFGIRWIGKIHRELEEKQYPRTYNEWIERYAAEYEIPHTLVYAVIRTESNFRPDAVSHAGAVGLMQFMPETFEWVARRLGETHTSEERTDPELSIRYGCYYLAWLHGSFGQWVPALAAYNAGPTRVRRWLEDPALCEDGELKEIPIDETSAYIRRIADAEAMYRSLYYSEEDPPSFCRERLVVSA